MPTDLLPVLFIYIVGLRTFHRSLICEEIMNKELLMNSRSCVTNHKTNKKKKIKRSINFKGETKKTKQINTYKLID